MYILYYICCNGVCCSIWLDLFGIVGCSDFFWRGNDGVGVFLVKNEVIDGD